MADGDPQVGRHPGMAPVCTNTPIPYNIKTVGIGVRFSPRPSGHKEDGGGSSTRTEQKKKYTVQATSKPISRVQVQTNEWYIFVDTCVIEKLRLRVVASLTTVFLLYKLDFEMVPPR